jgi:general secretion pathway protein K
VTASARERGFALLIVLWTVGLMALLLTRVVASGRVEVQVAGNLRVAAVAEATADGAVHEAVFRLLAGTWPADGKPHRVRIGEGAAEVRVENLAGRLNPNETPLAVMRRLLVDIGADPARAAALAAAMEDWRTEGDDPLPLGAKSPQYRAAGLPYVPTGKPFRDLQEIGLVFGMSPDLLAALGPHLSVFQEGETDLRRADALVARAIAASDGATARAIPDDDPGRPLVVEIAAATLSHGKPVFTRRAVVRFAAVSRSNPTPWRVLAWDGIGE